VSYARRLGGAKDLNLQLRESRLIVRQEKQARRPGDRRFERARIVKISLRPRNARQRLQLARIAKDCARRRTCFR